MKRVLMICAALATSALGYEAFQGPTELLYWAPAKTADGYTFFGVRGTTYLVDMQGRVVHTWPVGTNPHLLDDGSVLDASKDDPSGFGGFVQVDWNGSNLWSYTETRTNYFPHHDFVRIHNPKLGSNTTLYIANRNYTHDQCVAAGCNPATGAYTNAQMDVIVEVDMGGNIVWEWAFWDHMIQDFDPARNNYGVVSNHVELIDVNGPGIKIPQFWNHVNGIDYNAQLDQVMLSIRGNSELFVIDHQLTTAQAAGHSGGRYGKGGDILYRWGYAQQYDRSAGSPRMLYQQHHTHWIETNCPGAGNILIFNNGIGRGYSSVNEIVPPVDGAGNYALAGGAAYGPSTNCWLYTSSPPTNFYSSEISGAQRLPNGNTLICAGIFGDLFEVNTAGTLVWRYICPETDAPLAQGSAVASDPARPDQLMNAVFRVNRYPTNYVGLAGKDLAPLGSIETYTGASTDTDADGLPDVWERAHFGGLSRADGGTDTDGDGRSDRIERQLGLDSTKADTDGDGMPDGWEIDHTLAPAYAADAALTNLNLFTNFESYTADLDPTDPSSRLAILSIARADNDVEVAWTGGSGAWQSVECCDSLTDTHCWRALCTNTPPTPVTNTLLHPGAAAAGNLFYRIKAWR